MSILSITEGADPNYLATVVVCPELKVHPNADRLQIATVFGNDIIVAKGAYTPGERLIYFPVESCLSQKFLSWANLLEKPELNADGKTKGFFNNKNGRVRAVKLREVPSQGFLFKVSELAKFYGCEASNFKVGDIFDTVNGDILVKKYVRNEPQPQDPSIKKGRVPKWLDKTISVFPRPVRRTAYTFVNGWYNRKSEGVKSQLVDGQFAFHYKTEHLGKNSHLVKPNSYITITSKVHGTSAIFSNIICKKSFNPFRFIANKLGAKIADTEYRFIYSSRSVIKNRRDGKFTDDVWGLIASELQDEIPEDYSVYGEIVGYTPSGKTIQKNYNYGLASPNCEFWVYRITRNMPDGSKYELERYEIEEFCLDHGLKTVPIYYNGYADDLFPELKPLKTTEQWNSKFIEKLKETYLDKTCEFCTTGVINEGVVLRIENVPNRTALKFKSPLFVLKESSDRDNGEVDMEENS